MTDQRFFIEIFEMGEPLRLEAVYNFLGTLSAGRWQIDIKRYKKKRSNNQNSLIHAWFEIIAQDSGNTLDRVKSCLKGLYLTRDMKDNDGNVMCDHKTGEVLTYVEDTHNLNTAEMAIFTEEVRLWAMEFGIYLPLPDEQEELRFKK